MNQFRAHQIHQNQVKRVQNLIKDTEADEVVLRQLEDDKKRSKIPLQKCRTYDSSRTKRHRKKYLHI